MDEIGSPLDKFKASDHAGVEPLVPAEIELIDEVDNNLLVVKTKSHREHFTFIVHRDNFKIELHVDDEWMLTINPDEGQLYIENTKYFHSDDQTEEVEEESSDLFNWLKQYEIREFDLKKF
jgi:hypothetical protein